MTAPLADYAPLPLPLTSVERQELTDYEATIQRGLNTFYDVAAAFVHIKQRKLYRAEYRTFEEYCREKWNIDRSYADRMIAAAEVRENLVPMGTVLPDNERQARALTGLEPDQQRQVWQKAVDTAPNGKVTAQHIHDVRQQEIPMPAPKQEPQAAPVKQVSVFIPPNHPHTEETPGVTCPVCETPTPLKYTTYGKTGIYCPACRREWPSVKVMQELWETPEQDDDEPDEREPEAEEDIYQEQRAQGRIDDYPDDDVEIQEHCCTYCHGTDHLYNTMNGLTVCRACIAEHAARDLVSDKAFHFMHQDRARMCAAGLVVLRVDLYKRNILSYDPQKGGSWKLRLKCKNDGEMMDAIARISEEPNTIFENRV